MSQRGFSDLDRAVRGRFSFLATGIGLELGLGIIACGIGRLLDVRPESTLRFTSRSIALGIVATLPLLALLATLRVLPFAPLQRIRRLAENSFAPLFAGSPIVGLAALAAAAGLGEELLFRGLIQGGLERLTSPSVALILASLAFGLAHPFTVTYVLLAAAIGAYLGTVWQLTGNLLVPVAAHGLYDFLALLWLIRRPASHLPRKPTPPPPPDVDASRSTTFSGLLDTDAPHRENDLSPS